VENDPQLRHRKMYLAMEHPALGTRKVQNAPFKLANPGLQSHAQPADRSAHPREIVESLLGYSHEELRAGLPTARSGPPLMRRFPI
jgi:crotonobetainyl-CoA:carnitine CoA-transferase CaiB-like acyl-CoA transferase